MYRPGADVQYLQPQGYGLCFFRLLTPFVINKSGLTFLLVIIICHFIFTHASL
jgi:hypothetical protein